jgi:dienelactone hydrolase
VVLAAIAGLLFFSFAFAQGKPPATEISAAQQREYNGLKFLEYSVTTHVPFTTGFFSKTTENIEVRGVLMLPDSQEFKKPYPVLIYSHGSQDGGTMVRTEPRSTRPFLEQGYAVFVPIRKGFNRPEWPKSAVQADTAEPIMCGNAPASEAGVQSAIYDVTAFRAALTSVKDIDLSKIILMGQSRGGFLSLALAAKRLPGVIGVINFAGGWYSDRCFVYFNSEKFKEFGEAIEVPVISFYGDSDSYYRIQTIKSNLELLGKKSTSQYFILAGGSHVGPISTTSFWRDEVVKFLQKINP